MSDIRMPQRQSNRMKHFDYGTPGAYFVTSCTDLRMPLFGHVENQRMILSPLGQLVNESLGNLGQFIPGVTMAARVVMPNHIHAIIHLDGPVQHDAFAGIRDKISLPLVMQRFKSFTGKMYLKGVNAGKWRATSKNLWQRSYHDIILRNERDEIRLEKYILNNPASWERDRQNPNWKIQVPRRV